MRSIKTLRNASPDFIKITTDYSCLVQLIPDPSAVKRHEKFITYDGRWVVQRMGTDRYPMICGVHNTLHGAVFQARK